MRRSQPHGLLPVPREKPHGFLPSLRIRLRPRLVLLLFRGIPSSTMGLASEFAPAEHLENGAGKEGERIHIVSDAHSVPGTMPELVSVLCAHSHVGRSAELKCRN